MNCQGKKGPLREIKPLVFTLVERANKQTKKKKGMVSDWMVRAAGVGGAEGEMEDVINEDGFRPQNGSQTTCVRRLLACAATSRWMFAPLSGGDASLPNASHAPGARV